MTRKMYLRRKFEKRFKEQRTTRRRAFINRFITRLIGILIILISVAIVPLMDNYDATHCLVTVPLGIMVLIFPQCCDVDIFEFWEEFKEDFKNDFL
jgi:ACR3 family arsenite efflux pump ArsB